MYKGPAVLFHRSSGKEIGSVEADLNPDPNQADGGWKGTLTFNSEDTRALVQSLGDYYALRLGEDGPQVDAVARHQDVDDREVLHVIGTDPLP